LSTTITLKIRDRGHIIAIPGVAPFRTPAKIDVTVADIRTIIGHLKVCGVEEYEIIAHNERGDKEVYKKEDFELPKKEGKEVEKINYQKQIDKRFNKLEKMIAKLASKNSGNQGNNKEQITNKLEKLELIAQKILDEATTKEVLYMKTPGQIIKDDNIEDLEDAYIPEVDVSDMKMVSSGVQTLKQDDDDLKDSADMLSNLTGKK